MGDVSSEPVVIIQGKAGQGRDRPSVTPVCQIPTEAQGSLSVYWCPLTTAL